MSKIMRPVWLVFTLAILSACNTLQVGTHYRTAWAEPQPKRTRDLFVTIDGTANSPVSRTNAARLFEIVDAHSLPNEQNQNARATYYAEGVGGNGAYNLLGLAGAFGMSDDIRNAYSFLTVHYRPGDRIFLSGFSRGAYGVRALGGMIHVAGIPDLSHMTAKKRSQVVRALFRAYKTSRRSGESRRDQHERRLKRIEKALKRFPEVQPRTGVTIEAMALWDTVEAVGIPKKNEDPREELSHYLLTNCNVNKVFHALALDDNRADLFTPILADAKHIYQPCGWKTGDDRIEEVWFAGAHSDTSGSYPAADRISDHLAGVSLNWMLEKMAPYNLYPQNHRVFADPFAAIHDAREGLFVYKALDVNHREPIRYQMLAETEIGAEEYSEKQFERGLPKILPKIHASAIARLSIARQLDKRFAQCPPSAADPNHRIKERLSKEERKRIRKLPKLVCSQALGMQGLVLELKRRKCLRVDKDGFHLTPDQKCIHIVGEAPTHWPKRLDKATTAP